MPLGGEGVRRDQREAGDEADGLPQDVFERGIVRALVVGIQGQHAAGQLVHDVAAGGLEDHVLGEGGGHLPGLGHDVIEALQLRAGRELAEQEQVGDLFIAEGAVLLVRGDDILDADAAVVKLAGHRHALAVHHIVALDAADLADADEHAGAVRVPKAALDALVLKIMRVDRVLLRDILAQPRNVVFKKRRLFRHGSTPSCIPFPALYTISA